MNILATVLVWIGSLLAECRLCVVVWMTFFWRRAVRLEWGAAYALALLVAAAGCASSPTNAYVQPEQPEQELATIDWGGAVWGGSRAPDVTAIDGQPVASQLVGSIAKVTTGEHTIGFEFSIYRGPYAMPAHSYSKRTLTFTAEAGHRYRLFTDCFALGSSNCSSWIEDLSTNIAVAGKLPSWADPDLAARSYDAAKVRERNVLFEARLASVCAGDRPASQVALYFLAGIAPVSESDLATAYAWYDYGALRGDVEASTILENIQRDLPAMQRPQAGVALLPATACSIGTKADPGESVQSEAPAEGM